MTNLTSISLIRQKLRLLDWSFIGSSTMLSVGIAVARVLGLAYSLVLARAFSPEDYGYVQYSITLAGVIAIGTQPFVQHVLARFVSKHKDSSTELQEILNNTWLILLALTLGTLIVVVLVSLISGTLNIGALVIFIGLTLFYTYFGLARGFLANYKLLAMHLGSNVIQLLAVIVVVTVLGSRSVLLALLIYGLSYVLPWVLLQAFAPFPISFRLTRPQRERIAELLRFSAPIWVSHVGYMIYLSLDVILLERFQGNAAVGIYSLSKTLSMVFSFIPMGLTVILMPKIAASPRHMHRRLMRNALIWSSIVNVIGLLIYAALYNPVVHRFFGTRYEVGPEVFMVLALGNVVYGVYSIIASVAVGKDRASFEMFTRIACVLAAVLVGMILIPSTGAMGAALTTLVGAGTGLVAFGVIKVVRQKENSKEKPYANR
ncbi:MAG: oligosaccharide flippase family protein [Anaerolineae bacterium]|nr:oligosaccharide flippase family protein [Anaerolineae bacterium]